MAYIDTELVLNELKEELEYDTPFYTQEQNQYVKRGIKIAIMDINRTPTADTVEVVRCMDCVHYYDGCCYVGNRSPLFKYDVNIHHRKKNDFCSYGERKE